MALVNCLCIRKKRQLLWQICAGPPQAMGWGGACNTHLREVFGGFQVTKCPSVDKDKSEWEMFLFPPAALAAPGGQDSTRTECILGRPVLLAERQL